MKIKKKSDPSPSLVVIQNEWKDCTKCEIGKHVRNHVFLDTIPEGLTKVDFVIIGEGPGQIEDVKAKPFVGPAGQLLRKAITEAGTDCPECEGSGEVGSDALCPACLGYGGIRIALLNLLVCRPYSGKPMGTGNRPPTESEVFNCLPRLVGMLKSLNPETIFLAGKEAESYRPVINEELANDMQYVNIKHPSYLLRQGGEEGVLYNQYVDQLRAYFKQYFDGNIIDHRQRNNQLPGEPREPRK